MITSIRTVRERLKSTKVNSRLIFLCSLIGGIVLAAVLSRVDWSTIRKYTSEKGGYSLRFPLTWSLHVEEVIVKGTRKYHPVRNIIELDVPGKEKPSILISHNQTLEPQPVIDYIRNSSECSEVGETDGEIIMISGVEGRMFRDTKCAESGETRIYAMHGRTGYNFVFKGSPADMDIINHVIRNFTLLEAQ